MEYGFLYQCTSRTDGLIDSLIYPVVGKAGSWPQNGQEDSEHFPRTALSLLPRSRVAESLEWGLELPDLTGARGR